MTLNQYIYDIKGLLRNHNLVDEDLLTDRMVEFWIVAQRYMWTKRRDRAFIDSDHSLTQTIITDVISIDRSFNPSIISARYKTLRSKTMIPKPINFESWDGIINTGPVDIVSKRFNHTSYQEAVSSGNGRFNRNEIYTYYLSGYLYFISQTHDEYWKLLSKAAITGIWEDPREVGNFNHVDGTPCWTPDMDYPLSLELWNFMKEEIRRGNVEELVKIPVDKSNDDNSENNEMA
jgi:hypothetical protein